jgi:hypothetical protein
VAGRQSILRTLLSILSVRLAAIHEHSKSPYTQYKRWAWKLHAVPCLVWVDLRGRHNA